MSLPRVRTVGLFHSLPRSRRDEAPVLVLIPNPLLALADRGVLARHGVARGDVSLEVGLGTRVAHLLHPLEEKISTLTTA